jgi:molybdate transport system substrate-binding protein
MMIQGIRVIQETEMMWKKDNFFIFSMVIACCICLLLTAGCGKQERILTVYCGKGLKMAMEEVKETFERTYDVHVHMVYAGSETLLRTIKKTGEGDIFIPGSATFLRESGELVLKHQYVADHIPVFAIRKDNPKVIKSFSDLLQPGLKLAVGNRDMCAIGRVADSIIMDSDWEQEFTRNIAITGSTVNELLDLVLRREVDASLIWKDMLSWPEAQDLQGIEIPETINKPKKIHVAVLSTTAEKKTAILFADFVATEGRAFFRAHGFGDR